MTVARYNSCNYKLVTDCVRVIRTSVGELKNSHLASTILYHHCLYMTYIVMVNPQTLLSGAFCLKTTTRRSTSSNKSWALYVTAPSLIKLTHPPTSLFSMVTPSKVPTTTIVRYTARLFRENPTSYHPRTNFIIARALILRENAHNKIVIV